MNAITQTSEPTKLDQFRMEILPPERSQEFFSGMPAHVKPERFLRNLDNALMQNPGLMSLDARLIFREVSKAAALGLYLDPQLGEAYIIESWNAKKKRKEPQLRIGYKGLIKLGRQSGSFTIMYAHEVHENDTFDCDLGAEKLLSHKPDVFSEDRGPIVGYYAVVKYKDGEFDFEPLSINQAHQIRDRSDGWKAFQAGRIKSTPWSTDEVEMAKKTAIRKLCKRVPQSPELADAFSIEDAAEHSDMRTVNMTPPKPPKPPRPPSIEHGKDAGAEVDSDTGEIVDVDVFDAQAFLEQLDESLAGAMSPDVVEEVWNDFDVEATLEGDDDSRASADKMKALRLDQITKEQKSEPAPSSPGSENGGKASQAADKSPSEGATSPEPSGGGDQSKEDETPEERARKAGAAARASGMARKAVPAEYRKDERLLEMYLEGFDG